ncbi:monovalent cation/H+ antiporter subunit D family protein [Kocuria marina]|uniref:monovalent cation/H+ antiporter subunit D family protein n=1 Tax=Kocuria marina TaxID=223184 RepID=UPI003F26357C
MSGALLPLFVALPLLLSALLLIVGDRRVLHAVGLFGALLLAIGGALWLVTDFAGSGGAVAHGVAQWPVGISIPFVADMFAALMLAVTGALTLVCSWFAYASGRSATVYFAPLVLVLTAGVNGALLTADLFNLFVFIEVMLLPSYGLFVLAARRKGTEQQVMGARLYVTLNLLTSTIFLMGVGFIYGTAGTVNMGELAGRAATDGTVAISAAVCLFALAIKSAVVPIHGWLAVAYPATSPAITALFSGLHTKVAIYAIYRIYAVVFDGDAHWLWIGVALCCLTMVAGVLGAVGEKTTRSVLAFHMISQIGYILLGVALFTLAGLAAGIFYLLHHMIVKASLFLSTGAIEVRYGTGRIGALSGMAKREPVIAVAFFVAALSLAGLPPFSGFVAKFSLILAAVDTGHVIAVIVMLAVSLVTLLSMLKIWNGVFWGCAEAPAPHAPAPAGDGAVATASDGVVATASGRRISAALAGPAVVTACLTLALGLGAEVLMGVSTTAAEGLLDTSTYVKAVMDS